MQNLIFHINAFPVAAETYKEYLGGVDWVLTSEVVIAGIVIVMLVLILLILIFKGLARQFQKVKNPFRITTLLPFKTASVQRLLRRLRLQSMRQRAESR